MTRASPRCDDVTVPSIEGLVAPVATVVAVRVHMDPTQSTLELLSTTQRFLERPSSARTLEPAVLQRMLALQDESHYTLQGNILSQAAIGESEGAGLCGRLGLRMVDSWMLMRSYGVIVVIEAGQKWLELEIISHPGF